MCRKQMLLSSSLHSRIKYYIILVKRLKFTWCTKHLTESILVFIILVECLWVTSQLICFHSLFSLLHYVYFTFFSAFIRLQILRNIYSTVYYSIYSTVFHQRITQNYTFIFFPTPIWQTNIFPLNLNSHLSLYCPRHNICSAFKQRTATII